MICLECDQQFDIYNAIVDDHTGLWSCPDCGVALTDDDAKEVYDEISKDNHQV